MAPDLDARRSTHTRDQCRTSDSRTQPAQNHELAARRRCALATHLRGASNSCADQLSNADCFSVSNGAASALAASPSKESGRVCARSGPKAVAVALIDGRTRWEVSSAVDVSFGEKKVRLVPPAGGVGPDHFVECIRPAGGQGRPPAAAGASSACNARARAPRSGPSRRPTAAPGGGGGARPEDCSAAAQLETFAFLLRGAGFAFASEGSLWLQGFGQRPGLRAVRGASSRGCVGPEGVKVCRIEGLSEAPLAAAATRRGAGPACLRCTPGGGRSAAGVGAGRWSSSAPPAAARGGRLVAPVALPGAGAARAPGELVAGSFASERVVCSHRRAAPGPAAPVPLRNVAPPARAPAAVHPGSARNEARGKAPAKPAKVLRCAPRGRVPPRTDVPAPAPFLLPPDYDSPPC
eukprot:tig00000189_g14323.t1